MKELDRVEVDLAESNAALRRMSEAQGDSSSGSDVSISCTLLKQMINI